jgi:hypothetical protein
MTEEELWEFADELDREYEQELRHMARQQGSGWPRHASTASTSTPAPLSTATLGRPSPGGTPWSTSARAPSCSATLP